MNKFCEPVDVVEADGHAFRAGDRIAFEAREYDVKRMANIDVVRVAVIDELWREDHPNVGRLMWYAETSAGRMWFHRDRPRHANEVEQQLGAQPEGALF